MVRNKWWDAWGPTSKSCEHHHRTEEAAADCAHKHDIEVITTSRGHAHSDRAPRKHDAITTSTRRAEQRAAMDELLQDSVEMGVYD